MNLMKLKITLLLGSLFSAHQVFAAEQAKSVYLLGVNASMSGMAPPPGTYVSSFTYLYSGDATGGAALSIALPDAGTVLPSIATLQVDADIHVKAKVALDVLSLLWVAKQQVLRGHFGIGVLLPFGYQEVRINVNALRGIIFPNGTVLQNNSSREISDNIFAVGDPLATAFIGWSSGNWHWKIAGLVNFPIGQYEKTNLVNMGFNRWAADLTASTTWLDPKSGFEVSLAAGSTFNGENSATNYKTGTEFHFEGAMMKHFSKDFSFGVAGYHYEQISGDGGEGAILGDFKGRVSAIGPNLTYNFNPGKILILTSIRWLHEFNVENRLQGDVVFATLTIPLSGAPAHK